MWHTYPCTGLPAPTGIQYILVFPLMIKLSHPPHPLPPPISRLHMPTEVGAHKHIQSFAKVVAFTGNPPLETSCRYALMSSAYWLTRVHCRGFQGHSKSAVTSEHFKINLGHRVKRLHCRAVWLDGGKCLKMEAELWCEWPPASTPHPEKKKKIFGTTIGQRPLTTAERSSEIPLFTGLWFQFLGMTASMCGTFNLKLLSACQIKTSFLWRLTAQIMELCCRILCERS